MHIVLFVYLENFSILSFNVLIGKKLKKPSILAGIHQVLSRTVAFHVVIVTVPRG